MYLLDGGTCFALLRGSRTVRQRIEGEDPTRLRLCSPVKVELLGAARSADDVAARLDLLQRFFEPFTSLPFDDRCAEYAAQLQIRDPRLDSADRMLAAVALAHDLTLVTPRAAEFARVPGLPVEDWTRQISDPLSRNNP